MNHLPNDLMSLILNIRTEGMKKDLDKKIEEWKKDSEDSYVYMTNEISEYFMKESSIHDHPHYESCKFYSPFEVLQLLREEKEDALNNQKF